MASLNFISRFKEARAAAEPLPPGSAPYTNSSHFKTLPPRNVKSRRWDHHLSDCAWNFQVSPLKKASRDRTAKQISLGTARPTPEYYPWLSFSTHCLQSAESANTNGDGPLTAAMSSLKGEVDYDLSVVMNYGYSAGSPQMVRFLTEHMEMLHQPPYDNWETSLTCGTTSAIEITFRMLCNPGEVILAEKYTYSGTITAAQGLGFSIQGIETDDEGLLPGHLEEVLDNWNCTRGRKPHVLYTIPTGQNPTGATQSLERRLSIYQVAEKHDLILVEDDPYYLVSLDQQDVGDKDSTGLDSYLTCLSRSYLSMDESGRVLRMDSASKILAPGLRCGWITGCSQLIEKFILFSEVGVLSPSGPTQLMMYKLLDQTWGHEGFISWLQSLSRQYSQRLHMMLRACQIHLPSTICRWQVPTHGMFMLIRVDHTKHPRFQCSLATEAVTSFCSELESTIYEEAQKNNVVISKGSWFLADKTQLNSVSFRLTFAAAPESDLAEGMEGFGKAVMSAFASSAAD